MKSLDKTVMSTLLLQMCILNYPIWTCTENSWVSFCVMISTFYVHRDHRTKFSYWDTPQFWLNFIWLVQLLGSLDSAVFLQRSIIILVIILKLASNVHGSTCFQWFCYLCPAFLIHCMHPVGCNDRSIDPSVSFSRNILSV